MHRLGGVAWTRLSAQRFGNDRCSRRADRNLYRQESVTLKGREGMSESNWDASFISASRSKPAGGKDWIRSSLLAATAGAALIALPTTVHAQDAAAPEATAEASDEGE